MGKQPSHRCPDCHKPFHSAEGVIAHRTEEQGDCYGKLSDRFRRKILWYQQDLGVIPSPLPAPLPDFDLIDDGDPNE